MGGADLVTFDTTIQGRIRTHSRIEVTKVGDRKLLIRDPKRSRKGSS